MDQAFNDWQAGAAEFSALGKRFAEPALRAGEALTVNAERNVEALSEIATAAAEAWWKAGEAAVAYGAEQGRGMFRQVAAEVEKGAAQAA